MILPNIPLKYSGVQQSMGSPIMGCPKEEKELINKKSTGVNIKLKRSVVLQVLRHFLFLTDFKRESNMTGTSEILYQNCVHTFKSF